MKGGHSLPVSGRTAVALWLVPVLLLATASVLSSRILLARASMERMNTGEARPPGLFFEIGRRPAFAFGFRNLLADLAWLQAVQTAGSSRLSHGDYDRLASLLRVVGSLDPRFVVPYLLGGLILGDSPAHAEAALDILERGMEHHPADWRFPFYMGYIRYFTLGDPVGGGESLGVAARIPDSPPYLPLLATRMLSEGNRPETALAFLRGIEREETDPARIEILRKRIREVVVERDIRVLERAAETYRREAGARPTSLEDLVRAGLIPRVPEEPHGGRYILEPGGAVRSDRVKERLKVFRPR